MDDIISEQLLRTVVDVLVRVVEAAGAIVIFVGSVIAFSRWIVVALVRRRPDQFMPVRLDFGRYLMIGLEFQLASDILRTAVAPTFAEIGRLAAIATIRTLLNYFLRQEIKEEREELRAAAERTR